MIDKNGVVIEEGMQVWFEVAGAPRMGTVRNIHMVDETYMAWIDDGEPEVSDPRRNRFTVRRRTTGDLLEVVTPDNAGRAGAPAVSARDASTWEQVGVVSVDAGMIWLGDPCYILHAKKPKAIGKSWGDFARIVRPQQDAEQLSHDKGHPGLGVVVRPCYGDGLYPVRIRRTAQGEVAEVSIVFAVDKSEAGS